jgi:NADH-quinone oxidoreductase subunit M
VIATAVVALPLAFALFSLLPPLARRTRWLAVLAGLGVAALALAGPLLPLRASAHASWAPLLGLSYAVELDALGAMFVAVTGVVFAAAVASSDRVGHARAYHALLCTLLAAMTGGFVARDLALFLAFWEAALALAALLISQWGGVGRADAAVRVLVTALIGSALYIVVIVSLAVARGSLDVDVLRARPLPASAQLLPAALLCGAFLTTVPVLPFQSWLVRVFISGPREVALLLTVGVSSLALYAVIRFCAGLFPLGMSTAAPAFVALTAVGTLYGAIIASRQDDPRRFVAFVALSSINLAAIGAFTGTDAGIRGAALASLSRSLVLSALVIAVAFVTRRTRSASLAHSSGLAVSSPALAALTTLAVFAVVGVPGTSGFVADYLVLAGAYERFPAATVVVALVFVASAIWAARFARRVFHGPPLARAQDLRWREAAVIVPLVVLSIAIGVAPRVITDRVPADVLPALESPR